MKYIFASVLTLYSMSPVFAEFHPIKEKFCDQRPIAVEKNERIFIDLSISIIGIGADEAGCRVVDFKQVVITRSSDVITEVAASSSIGRRSSCSSDMGPYQGLEYSMAVLYPGSVQFSVIAGPCSRITYKF